MEPWGGVIETPNIKRIAANGLSYTNFHITARMVVDVSGEPYVDLEHEAAMAMKRG